MTTDKKAHSRAFTIDEILGQSDGQSERRRRAFEHRSDVLEAAALIRELRKRAGLSQEELAKRIGTHQSHISELERGNGQQGPTFTMLKRIARACGDPLVFVREKEWLSALREIEEARKAKPLLQGQKPASVDKEDPSRIIQLHEKGRVTHLGQSSIHLVRVEHNIDQRLSATPTAREILSEVLSTPKLTDKPQAAPELATWIPQIDQVDRPTLH